MTVAEAELKPFLTVDETAFYLRVSRATVWNYMKDLKIEAYKFPRDRKAYLAREDVKRIQAHKEQPWLQD